MKIEDVDKGHVFWDHLCNIVQQLKPVLDEYEIDELSCLGTTLKNCLAKLQNYVDIYNENATNSNVILLPEDYVNNENDES